MREVNIGDQIVVAKDFGRRIDPVVVTIVNELDTVYEVSPTYNGLEDQVSKTGGDCDDVYRPTVRKGDTLHVFRLDGVEYPEGLVATALEDETEDDPTIEIESIEFMFNVIDLRDNGLTDEWYFYDESIDYPTEDFFPALVEREPIDDIADSYNAVEAEDASLVGGLSFGNHPNMKTSVDPIEEDEYTPQSFADFNAAHGGGKTLKDYTGVEITEDTLGFKSDRDTIIENIDLNFTPVSDEDAVDMVNHPPHYNRYEREVIESIRGLCTPEEFRGYLKGNVIKYVARYQDKGGEMDLGKSGFYNEELRKFVAESNE